MSCGECGSLASRRGAADGRYRRHGAAVLATQRPVPVVDVYRPERAPDMRRASPERFATRSRAGISDAKAPVERISERAFAHQRRDSLARGSGGIVGRVAGRPPHRRARCASNAVCTGMAAMSRQAQVRSIRKLTSCRPSAPGAISWMRTLSVPHRRTGERVVAASDARHRPPSAGAIEARR